MASLLESLEHHFASLTVEIASGISQIPTLTSTERNMAITNVVRQVEEAHEVLEQMDLEVKGMPPATREKDMLPYRLKTCSNQLIALEKGLYKARMSGNSDASLREELFEGDTYVKDEQKQCLLDNTEKLERASRQLDGGYRIAVETEQIGAQVLCDLQAQRESLKKAKARMHDTNYDIGKSSRILNSMIRGLLQQRVILSLAFIGLFITITLGIYFLATKR